MKKILQISVIFSLLVLASCGSSEDPAPPHIVGTWELENFILANLPSAYSQSDGLTFGVTQITLGGVSFTSYVLEIANDGTYVRKVGIQGAPSSNDQGTWTLSEDGNDLKITVSGEDTGADWDVSKNELDQLWISQPSSFTLFSDATRDQLIADHGADGVSDYLDTLTDEEFAALLDQVTLDLVYAFKRGS